MIARILHAIFVFVIAVFLFSFIARMMDDSDARWTTGAAVWGAALAVAAVDFTFAPKRRN